MNDCEVSSQKSATAFYAFFAHGVFSYLCATFSHLRCLIWLHITLHNNTKMQNYYLKSAWGQHMTCFGIIMWMKPCIWKWNMCGNVGLYVCTKTTAQLATLWDCTVLWPNVNILMFSRYIVFHVHLLISTLAWYHANICYIVLEEKSLGFISWAP